MGFRLTQFPSTFCLWYKNDIRRLRIAKIKEQKRRGTMMHLARLVTLAICLLWAAGNNNSSAGAVSTKPPRSRHRWPPGYDPGYLIVYRGDNRSPAQIREAGGFRPLPGWQSQERAFVMDNNYRRGAAGCDPDPDPSHVTAYVSLVTSPRVAAGHGRFVYEIRATPNFFLSGDSTSHEVYALGGVQWRQIRRYGQTNRQHAYSEVDMLGNSDYDENLYDHSRLRLLCRVCAFFPSQLQSGEPDGGADEDTSSPARRAAYRLMQTTEIKALAGSFPHTPVPGRFNMHGPFPGARQAPPNSGSERAVSEQLQFFIDLGPQTLSRIFPYGDRLIEEIFEGISWDACPAVNLPHPGPGGSHLRRSLFRTNENDSADGCCQATAALRGNIERLSAGAARNCTSLSALKFGLQLSDQWFAGTWDSLVVAFGAGETHGIASSPNTGFHEWQNIDMQRVFKSDVVPLHHLTKLRGRCADSLTELHLDRLQSENVKSYRPQVQHGVPWVAWSKDIDPSKDWATYIDCSHFKAIEVELRVPKSSSVVVEDLFVNFENEGINRNAVTARTKSFEKDHHVVTVLRRRFSQNPVPVRDIKHFGVYSLPKQEPIASWWKTIGLTVKGHCAGSNNVALFDKYTETRDKPEHRDLMSNDEREILMTDWRWATPETETELGTRAPSDFWLFSGA
ncbi:hypothetical protein JDV02_004946 [Purpureocillium takamizusanense]|uniref:Heat-labile enterotoxin n=1 Tax=Purpureocillium takamizusanense TaxID=2060973 RepID=A0A9Q8QGZ3_9HYPO|nr:uncharacterized protein JDV02_004946 [Purpureocillium takamizusanense]UNI18691.1 hypothetical protein JDV02_004946 [Purpureocillium takamizusanense]